MSIAPHIHGDATALAASLGIGFSGLVSRLIVEALGGKKSLLQQDPPSDTAVPTVAQIAQAMDHVTGAPRPAASSNCRLDCRDCAGKSLHDEYLERDALRAALAYAEKAHATSTEAALCTRNAMAFAKKAHVALYPPTPHP